MKRLTFIIIVLLYLTTNITSVEACTTLIVSGKFTKDGRPLLWKNRDTNVMDNKLMFFADGKYTYIALINSDDENGDEIWIGFNSAGFAIMNSASYNLNVDDTTGAKDSDGELMKLALQNCATVDEFENLLRELKKPMGVESNFGVMDAQGGAAFFETGNFAFSKLDANDPTIAPYGYLLHTNYSFTGKRDLGHGYIRFLTAEELLFEATGVSDLDYKFIIQKLARCLRHSLTNVDLYEYPLHAQDDYNFVPFIDFIPRGSSSSSVVIQGVIKGESPALTTMWTVLGFPLCSFTVPVWLIPDGKLPVTLSAKYPATAPLCDFALALKKQCFPVTRGNGARYLNLTALINSDKSGIIQKLVPFENEILHETKWRLEEWRKNGINYVEVLQYYKWIDEVVFPKYKSLF